MQSFCTQILCNKVFITFYNCFKNYIWVRRHTFVTILLIQSYKNLYNKSKVIKGYYLLLRVSGVGIFVLETRGEKFSGFTL